MAATRVRVVAGAIVYRFHKQKLEVLLVHQSDKRKNLWSIPKGGAKSGEDFEEAARREVEEETNVRLRHLDFLGYVDYDKANKRLYCYSGKCPPDVSLQIRVPEIDNAGFFEVSQAKKMVDKRQRPLIQALQKIIAFAQRQVVTA